jgi:hypothetical protein
VIRRCQCGVLLPCPAYARLQLEIEQLNDHWAKEMARLSHERGRHLLVSEEPDPLPGSSREETTSDD